jgi:hypothetical protein
MVVTELCPSCQSELELDTAVSEVQCPGCSLTLEIEMSFDEDPATAAPGDPGEVEEWTRENVSTAIKIVDFGADPESKSTSPLSAEKAPPIAAPADSAVPDIADLMNTRVATGKKLDNIKVAKAVQVDFISSIPEHVLPVHDIGDDAVPDTSEDATAVQDTEAEKARRATEAAEHGKARPEAEAAARDEEKQQKIEEAKQVAMQAAKRKAFRAAQRQAEERRPDSPNDTPDAT